MSISLESAIFEPPGTPAGADLTAVNYTRDGNFIQKRALHPAKGRQFLLCSVSLTVDYMIVFLTAVPFKTGLADSIPSHRA